MSTIRGTGVGEFSPRFLDTKEFQQACSTKGKKKKGLWDVSSVLSMRSKLHPLKRINY